MFSPVRSQQLAPAEKAEGRFQLQKFMQQHPVRKPSLMRQLWHGFTIPTLALNVSKPMIIALVLAISLAAGGGVTYAAEQSLPGDALYVVKTSINEPILEVLAVTPEAKVEVKARLVERRLEEAEALAVEGRLDEETRVVIEAQLAQRVEKAKELVEKFKEKDLDTAAEASARLDVALRTHERILESLLIKVDGQTVEFHKEVKAHSDDAEELEASLAVEDVDEDESDDDDEEERNEKAEKKQRAAEGKLKAARHKLEEVKKFVSKVKVSDETRAEAETRLTTVEQMVVEAQALYDVGTYEEAFEAAKKAHNAAQEVKVYVAAEKAVSARLELKLEERKEDREEKRDEKREEKREKKEERKEERRERDDDDRDEEDERDERDDDERDSKNLRLLNLRIEGRD